MNQPIKRHNALQPLSREHHNALLFCWKIREGIKRHVEPERIKQYVNWFWKTHLANHFQTEERYIFPILPAINDNIKQAISEHRTLQQLFEADQEIVQSFSLIEEALSKHIRFEERILFNEIQLAASSEQLETITKHHDELFCDDWSDEFWK